MIKCKEVVSSQFIKIVLIFCGKVAISLFRRLSAAFRRHIDVSPVEKLMCPAQPFC